MQVSIGSLWKGLFAVLVGANLGVAALLVRPVQAQEIEPDFRCEDNRCRCTGGGGPGEICSIAGASTICTDHNGGC